jgi:hypothetical protein
MNFSFSIRATCPAHLPLDAVCAVYCRLRVPAARRPDGQARRVSSLYAVSCRLHRQGPVPVAPYIRTGVFHSYLEDGRAVFI